MKRFLLALVVCVALCACGNEEEQVKYHTNFEIAIESSHHIEFKLRERYPLTAEDVAFDLAPSESQSVDVKYFRNFTWFLPETGCRVTFDDIYTVGHHSGSMELHSLYNRAAYKVERKGNRLYWRFVFTDRDYDYASENGIELNH